MAEHGLDMQRGLRSLERGAALTGLRQAGSVVLLSSHEPDLLAQVCDEIWWLEDGRLVEQGDNRFHAILGNDGPAKFVSASRIAPALIALGATARVIGPEAEDEAFLPVEQLYRVPRHEGERENSLRSGQILTHLILPPAEGLASATYEVRHGEGPDYPLAAASAALRLEGGVVREAKVVLGQVAPVPWISHEAAMLLVGRPVTPELAEAAGAAAVAQARPLSNNGYKVQLAKVAAKRAILKAAGLETGGF